jgi:hypothetical protein
MANITDEELVGYRTEIAELAETKRALDQVCIQYKALSKDAEELREALKDCVRDLKHIAGSRPERFASLHKANVVLAPRPQPVATGNEGVKGYLKWAALHKAERFLALMARVAPKQVFADVTHRDAMMTREEVEAEMRERGIPVELLNSIMKAPVELDWDEDPDPYNSMKDVTPVSTNGGDTEGNGTG